MGELWGKWRSAMQSTQKAAPTPDQDADEAMDVETSDGPNGKEDEMNGCDSKLHDQMTTASPAPKHASEAELRLLQVLVQNLLLFQYLV